MMRYTHLPLFLSVAVALAGAAETRVQFNDLPPAVQKAATEQTKGAQVRGYSKEVEKGKTYYEVELTADAKTRDLLLDESGAVVEVEQQVDQADVPAAAMQAIKAQAHGAKIVKVESVTKGGVTGYEAVVARGHRKTEIAVTSDGKPAKD